MQINRQTQEMPLDALPGQRCADALALLAFLRRAPIRWFVCGSKSAQVAEDLALCGKLHLRRDTYKGHPIIRIELTEVRR